jgi:hypothetical protein
VKYTVYLECLGGDEPLQHWDCNGDQSLGYDSTMSEDDTTDSQHWFDTLEEAREFVEFSDEYIQDEDGRLSDKDGNWYGHGKECSDCMGRGHQDSNIEDEKCDTCDGTGHFLGDGSRWYQQRLTERGMIATLKHELSKLNA